VIGKGKSHGVPLHQANPVGTGKLPQIFRSDFEHGGGEIKADHVTAGPHFLGQIPGDQTGTATDIQHLLTGAEVGFFHRKMTPVMMKAKADQRVDEVITGGDLPEIGRKALFF